MTSNPYCLNEMTTIEQEMGLQIPDALLQQNTDGRARLVVTNSTGFMQRVAPGVTLGEAVDVTVVDSVIAKANEPDSFPLELTEVVRVDTSQAPRDSKGLWGSQNCWTRSR